MSLALVSGPQPLADYVCVITGASRGIGRAAAVEFARLGCDLVVAARTDVPRAGKEGALGDVIGEIEALGRRVLAVRCDVGRQADLDNLVERTLSEFGRCDILINNAAVTSGKVFLKLDGITRNEFEKFMAVNLIGPLMLTQSFTRGMCERGQGLVFNVSSGAAQLEEIGGADEGAPVGITYGTSKAALNRLSNAMSRELFPSGVSCITVDPGFTATQGEATVASMDESGWTDRPTAHPIAWPVGVLRYLATSGRASEFAGRVVVTDEEFVTRNDLA
jgi:NAD(P)-dependent dehydrogenase (short-subunit alcohol dehydrogenase family)